MNTLPVLSNITIFMYGSGNKNSGVLEEYEIAKENNNRIIIPIGSTGGSAKIILDDVKHNIMKYPYLEKYIGILENEKNSTIISKTILTIINENLRNAL